MLWMPGKWGSDEKQQEKINTEIQQGNLFCLHRMRGCLPGGGLGSGGGKQHHRLSAISGFGCRG
jgi:hypothetical protein